jgi:hypothetical protein
MIHIRTRQRWILPCTIVALAFVVILGAIIWIYFAFHHAIDLGNKTPDHAFQFILKIPLPTEVYDVKTAGEAGLSGNMWMRFKTHDLHKTIDAFKQNQKLSIAGPTDQLIGLDDLNNVIDNKYANAVDWNKALFVKKPQYYKFTTIPEDTGWWGIFIVDRKHKTIYAWGDLL